MLSKQVIKDSDRYVCTGNKYFGVMVRVERVVLYFSKLLGFNKVMIYMTQCAKQLTRLQQFKDYHRWGRALAIDMGRMGSKGIGYIQGKKQCGVNVGKLFDLFLTSIFLKDKMEH